MKKDMTYCSHTTCLHRRGCLRSLQNYEVQDDVLSIFNGADCADVENAEDRYSYLIRFRLSDGSQ